MVPAMSLTSTAPAHGGVMLVPFRSAYLCDGAACCPSNGPLVVARNFAKRCATRRSELRLWPGISGFAGGSDLSHPSVWIQPPVRMVVPRVVARSEKPAVPRARSLTLSLDPESPVGYSRRAALGQFADQCGEALTSSCSRRVTSGC